MDGKEREDKEGMEKKWRQGLTERAEERW